jgi:hypothetical protein
MWLAESLTDSVSSTKTRTGFVDAGRHYHQALALAHLGPDDPRLANLLHNLARLDHAQNRLSRVNRMLPGP